MTRPTLRDVEARPRLFLRLDELRHESPAVWIAAPAGSGKTALLVSYVEARELPVVWYRVDERDQHVAELFFYLRLAAEHIGGSPSGSIELPVFSPGADLARFARRFFEAMFLRVPSGGLLVFDDYHTTSVGPQWQAAFEKCLASIPDGLNVVVISRQSPPGSLARSIAHRELAVLESSELLLSEQETAAIAARRLGKKHRLSAEAVATIHAATSGWAAGVSLLLRSRHDAGFPALTTRTIEPVFDYLTSAVFSEFSANTQTLLLHSACLRRFSLPELEELAGLPADRGELLSLYRSGFFLESDGPVEEVFRFHSLFRSFLSYRAEQVLGAEGLRAARARAAHMLQKAGRSEEAFELFLLLDDQPALCELVVGVAPVLFSEGRTAMLEQWIAALPAGSVAESGWLSHWHASCLLTSEPTRSLSIFERALANFERDQDGVGAYLAWAGAVQALAYEQRSFQLLEHWLERLIQIEAFSPAFSSPEIGAAVVSSLLMGLSLCGAESSVHEYWIARALSLSEKASDSGVRVMMASVVVLNYAVRGEPSLAATWLAPLERHGSDQPTALIGRVAASAARAALAWHEGRPGVCVDVALKGLELLGTNRVPMWQVALLVFGSFAALDSGAAAECERFVARLSALADSGTPLDIAGYHVIRALQALGNGDLKQALRSIELSIDRSRAVGLYSALAQDLHIAAYVHFELGDARSGGEALREAYGMAEAYRQPAFRYWGLLIEADQSLKVGDLENCVRWLSQAFAIGRELQVYNMHCPVPRRMAELCRTALEHDIERDYTRVLVRRKELFRYAAPHHLSSWPWPIQVRTLGGLEVLLDDVPLALGRIRMPLLLLRLLAADSGSRTGVPLGRVLAALWPESDGDNATHAFEMTLLRLRNQLGEHGRRALRVERGHVLLDSSLCWTDTAALTALLSEIGDLEPETARGPMPIQHCAALADRLSLLYRGPFAGEDDDATLGVFSERLRAKVAGAARSLGAALCRLDCSARAQALYLGLLEADALLDSLFAPAIACLMRSGARAEARALLDARWRRPEPMSVHDIAEAEAALLRA